MLGENKIKMYEAQYYIQGTRVLNLLPPTYYGVRSKLFTFSTAIKILEDRIEFSIEILY